MHYINVAAARECRGFNWGLTIIEAETLKGFNWGVIIKFDLYGKLCYFLTCFAEGIERQIFWFVSHEEVERLQKGDSAMT